MTGRGGGGGGGGEDNRQPLKKKPDPVNSPDHGRNQTYINVMLNATDEIGCNVCLHPIYILRSLKSLVTIILACGSLT